MNNLFGVVSLLPFFLEATFEPSQSNVIFFNRLLFLFLVLYNAFISPFEIAIDSDMFQGKMSLSIAKSKGQRE